MIQRFPALARRGNQNRKILLHLVLADQVRQLMQLILWKLESLRQWEKDSITATIQAVFPADRVETSDRALSAVDAAAQAEAQPKPKRRTPSPAARKAAATRAT